MKAATATSVIALIVSGAALAQVIPLAPTNLLVDGGSPVPTPPPTTNWPQPQMAGMPIVNAPPTIVLNRGSTTMNITSGGSPSPSGDGTGAFRITCSPSHMNFDDPLIYPGAANVGRSHHHTFWGNSSTNAMTNLDTLRTQGGSTCTGGTANKSAYWTPSMIDTRTGTPIAPTDVIVYYKSGYNEIPLSSLQPFPPGLKMLAGTPMKNTPYAADELHHNYHCHGLEYSPQQTIPHCPTGTMVLADLTFPNCWDGKNLDSANHKSHLAYASDHNGRCPSSHPVALTTITFSLYYAVKSGDDTRVWRLSSDMPDANGRFRNGQSLHGDWINGWDVDIQNAWLNNCVKAPRDCHADLLGDGRRLN